jgi:hypothetical protein
MVSVDLSPFVLLFVLVVCWAARLRKFGDKYKAKMAGSCGDNKAIWHVLLCGLQEHFMFLVQVYEREYIRVL